MKKQFIPYDLALKFKDLGFHEECFSAYRNTDGEKQLMGISIWTNTGNGYYEKIEGYCAAPLWQQAFDWIRNEFNLMLTVDLTSFGAYFFNIVDLKSFEEIYYNSEEYYKTFEEMQESSLLKLIDMIKQRIKS